MPREPHASAASGAPSFSCEFVAGSKASQRRTIPPAALASRLPSGENDTAPHPAGVAFEGGGLPLPRQAARSTPFDRVRFRGRAADQPPVAGVLENESR